MPLSQTNATTVANFTKYNITTTDLLTVEQDELPDLDNLSPEEQKVLEARVDKTMDVLTEALGTVSATADGGNKTAVAFDFQDTIKSDGAKELTRISSS